MKRVITAAVAFCLTIGLLIFSTLNVQSSLKKLDSSVTELYNICRNGKTEAVEIAKNQLIMQWEKTDVILELFVNGACIDAIERHIEAIDARPADDAPGIANSCIHAKAAVKQIAISEKITLKNIF